MMWADKYEFQQWGMQHCIITRFQERRELRTETAFAGGDYEVIEGQQAAMLVGDLFDATGGMPSGLREFAAGAVGPSGPSIHDAHDLGHALLRDLQDWCGGTVVLRSTQPPQQVALPPAPLEEWTPVEVAADEPTQHTLEYEALDERDEAYPQVAHTLAAPGDDDAKPNTLDGGGYRYHENVRRGAHTLAATSAVGDDTLEDQVLVVRLQRAGGGPLGTTPYALSPAGAAPIEGVTDAAGTIHASWLGAADCTLCLPDAGPRYVVATDGDPADLDAPTLLVDGVLLQAGAVVLEVGGFPATVVEMQDTLFRTESAVMMPGGAAPSAGAAADGPDDADAPEPTGVGLIAACLRFASEHPNKRLLIAGHADSTGDGDFNLALSEARARCVHTCLVGDRAAFVELAKARHRVADYKQILAWVAQAHGFACAPDSIDDDARTGETAVEAFQREYNGHRAMLFQESPELGEDGDIGPMTWGALFDCYEVALCDALGDGVNGLATLRKGLVFVDPQTPAIGFGEHHPVDALGLDEMLSQGNRRVEVLFFDPGEAPDVASAKAAPADSELYRKGVYVAEALRQVPGAPDDKPNATDEQSVFVVTPYTELDLDQGADAEFTLSGTGYRKTLTLASDSSPIADYFEVHYLEIEFQGVPKAGNYTLVAKLEGGDEKTVVDNVPFDQLAAL